MSDEVLIRNLRRIKQELKQDTNKTRMEILRLRETGKSKGIDFDEREEGYKKFREINEETDKKLKNLEALANQIPHHKQMKKRVAKKMLRRKVKKIFIT